MVPSFGGFASLFSPFRRKQAWTKESSNEELALIINSEPNPVSVTDSSGTSLLTNKKFRDMFNLSHEEQFCILTDYRTRKWGLKDAFSRVRLGETVVLPEIWRDLPGHTESSETREVCLGITLMPVRSSSGLVEKVYIKLEDCTQRRKHEQTIHKERSRLRNALEGSRQMVCEIDPATCRMTVDFQSSEEDQGHGFEKDSHIAGFERLVHPEDWEDLKQQIVQHASGEDVYLSHHFRVQADSGSWRWFKLSAKTTAYDEDGSIRYLGTMMDITQEYESRMNLQDSEAKYRAIFNHAVEGMYLVGMDDKVVCVNQAFASILGYDSPEDFEKDMQGKDFSQIYYIPNIRKRRQSTLLEKGQMQQMETQIQRRDGSLVWISENARAVHDEQGRMVYFEGSIIDITERKKSEERLLHKALYDQRTNLPNHSFLLEKLEKGLKKAEQDQGFYFGLLVFDLDGLGEINDSFGHMMGDRLLLEVSCRVQGLLRSGDTLARLSSDEFSVMAEDRQPGEIKDLAEHIRVKMAEPYLIDGIELCITISLGILFYNLNYTRPEDMLRDAEMAMQQAKQQGKNRCVTFVSEMYQEKSRRALMEKDLRRAIDHGELVLNYQPIVRLDGGGLKGFEALIRWKHPQRGMVSPGLFIPLAEETGLIEPIGDWVLQESCRQIKAWKEINDSFVLNINVSGRQLQKPGLERKLYQALQEENLDPGCLILEITESMAMAQKDNNLRILKRLKYMGVWLSIDDFGTGYSSLAHLQQFPLDELKIDRSFINITSPKKNNQRIIQAIVEMAHGLKLKLVAEGIETKMQLDHVKSFNCHYGQGYLFSKALDPASIEKTWLDPKASKLPG